MKNEQIGEGTAIGIALDKRMITILGPVALGRTDFTVHLAAQLNAEIISIDSRQVYRSMDIGTGRDLADCTVEGRAIPYHLIDTCEPGTKYNLFRYQQDFLDSYEDIRSKGVLPILCDGTGLYIEAVLKGYSLSPVSQNPELRKELEGKSFEELTAMLVELKKKNHSVMHNKTDVDSCQRAIRAIEIETYNLIKPTEERRCPPIDSLIIGVDIDREARRKRIANRLKARLEEGTVGEIEGLLKQGIPVEDLIYYGLEYKFVTECLIGRLSYSETFRRLEIAIHQFAKRQMTWFRGMERHGFTTHWVNAAQKMEDKVEEISSLW